MAQNNTLVMQYTTDQKVLEFLRTHPELDYTLNEITKGVGAKWPRSIQMSLNRLIKESKVIPIREFDYKKWTYQLPEWLTDARHDELNTIG